MKAISHTLDVSRSNPYDVQGKKRGPYRKAEDDVLLPLIEEITDARETSGYSHITVRLNWVLGKFGKPRVNRKRDYVYLNRLEDAATVMKLLRSWFEDCNETHPHKGLKMLSPREYRQSLTPTPEFSVNQG